MPGGRVCDIIRSEVGELWQRRWVRYRAIAAPFGILAVTALLAYLTESNSPRVAENLKHAASMVDLAVPIYAAIAVLVERGIVMVFWALEQRKKWRDERLAAQAARDAALRAEIRDEVMAELMAELRDQVTAEVRRELEQWARDKGISPDSLPPLPR